MTEDLTPPFWGAEPEYTYPEADPDQIFATIPLDELEDLIEDSVLLRCLNEAGVDNWEWYGEAMAEYKKEMSNGIGFFLKSDPE